MCEIWRGRIIGVDSVQTRTIHRTRRDCNMVGEVKSLETESTIHISGVRMHSSQVVKNLLGAGCAVTSSFMIRNVREVHALCKIFVIFI